MALVGSENLDEWAIHEWNVRTYHFIVDTFIHATITHQYPEVEKLGESNCQLVESLVKMLGCFQFLFKDATLCSLDKSNDDIRDQTHECKVPEW
jgi:hypothetical protein